MPPPDDWPVSVDRSGNPLSFFADDYWDFSAFGYYGFNFQRHRLSEENLFLAKQVLIFVMYHPRLFPGKISSCQGYFHTIVTIGKVCDQQKILIRDLHKFPTVFPLVVDALQGKKVCNRITQLHRLKLYSDELGFSIADDKLLRMLSRRAEEHVPVQHPYIPPRLWNYQVKRLSQVLDDFVRHQDAIVKAFRWLHSAYLHNLKVAPRSCKSPFTEQHVYLERILYKGGFEAFLHQHGLLGLIQRWIEPGPISSRRVGYKASAFSKYLSFVRDVSIIFIVNFSMQRKAEATSLRSDCFSTERDEYVGDICILSGETTKTIQDTDARWVVPPTVKKAVDVASVIARLRVSALPEDMSISTEDKVNPYLLFPSTELWSCNASKIRTSAGRHGELGELTGRRSLDYSNIVRRGLKLFEEEMIRITEDDAKVALAMTPNLWEREWFKIGKPWHFTAHQARRTLAVNMFASQDVSVGAIQQQMQHLSMNMTLYYGRHYTNLRLNSVAEKTVVLEFYKSVYQKLIDVFENETENVRPHGKWTSLDSVVDLICAGEEKKLMGLIERGQVGVRQTLLGYCVKAGACEYGGIESISKCAGGNGQGVCADAIFARKKKDKLRQLKAAHEKELVRLPSDSMRVGQLKHEIYAIGVYLDVIEQQEEGS